MKTTTENHYVKNGTRKVETRVIDPNGTIVHKRRDTADGPGEDAFEWQMPCWLGDNAMALTTLLRCGLTPEKEPGLQRIAEHISLHIDTFGIPDSTWDLAWAMIAFAEYPGGRYNGHIERLYGRLLSGQITQGPGRGLWGPVCVSPVLLRRVCEEFQALEQLAPPPAGQAPAWTKGAMGPRANPNDQAGVDAAKAKIDAAQERLFHAFASVSMVGSRFANATDTLKMPKSVHGGYENDVELFGWPVNVYREITGNLESTALAAYALRIVAERHALPGECGVSPANVPCDGVLDSGSLGGSVVAVAKAQRKDASWDEMVVWRSGRRFSRWQ